MATSGRHMARFSARNCAIGPVRTVPIHPSSQKRAASRPPRGCRGARRGPVDHCRRVGEGAATIAAEHSGTRAPSHLQTVFPPARDFRRLRRLPRRAAPRSPGGLQSPAPDECARPRGQGDPFLTKSLHAYASRRHRYGRSKESQTGTAGLRDLQRSLGLAADGPMPVDFEFGYQRIRQRNDMGRLGLWRVVNT